MPLDLKVNLHQTWSKNSWLLTPKDYQWLGNGLHQSLSVSTWSKISQTSWWKITAHQALKCKVHFLQMQIIYYHSAEGAHVHCFFTAAEFDKKKQQKKTCLSERSVIFTMECFPICYFCECFKEKTPWIVCSQFYVTCTSYPFGGWGGVGGKGASLGAWAELNICWAVSVYLSEQETQQISSDKWIFVVFTVYVDCRFSSFFFLDAERTHPNPCTPVKALFLCTMVIWMSVKRY